MVCSIASFDLYCAIGFVLRQCFSILSEFQVIRKGCIFSPFLPFVLLFVRSCCNSAFILELHRCSKGWSISRVQTENYYYRNGFCLSLWVNCWVGYCHYHLKCVLRSISSVQMENCMIDKQSPYLKLLLFSKQVLLVIVSETVEWAIAMLVAPLFLDTIWFSSYQERLYFYSAQNCQQETAGNEPAIGVLLHHWRLFFSIRFEFQVIRKGCEGSGDDSWSDVESLCDSDGNSNMKCGEVVSGKRVAWNVTRDVGWTLGELSGWGRAVKLAEVSVSVDLFLQCPSQVAAESSLSLARRLVRIGDKIIIAELGNWDMHAEHKQYIFKAITKTFDKPESLAQ